LSSLPESQVYAAGEEPIIYGFLASAAGTETLTAADGVLMTGLEQQHGVLISLERNESRSHVTVSGRAKDVQAAVAVLQAAGVDDGGGGAGTFDEGAAARPTLELAGADYWAGELGASGPAMW